MIEPLSRGSGVLEKCGGVFLLSLGWLAAAC